MTIPNGVHMYVQLSEALLDVNLRQQFDTDMNGLGGDEQTWHIEQPNVKLRATQSPDLSLVEPANADVFFPEADFEATVTVLGSELEGLPALLQSKTFTLTVSGSCTLTLHTGLVLGPRQQGEPGDPAPEAGKIYLSVSTTDAMAEVQVLDPFVIEHVQVSPSLGDGSFDPANLPLSDANRQRISGRIKARVNEGLAEENVFVGERLLQTVGIADVGVPVGQFRAAVAGRFMQIFATLGGPTPTSVPPIQTAHDLLLSTHASVMTPKIQEKINATVVGTKTKINANYKQVIDKLNANLTQGGFVFTGKARAVGKPNSWWEVFDWYPDLDIKVNKLEYLFKEVKPNGGSFVFEKGAEDIQQDKCDMAWLVISGILTFGLTWGANPFSIAFGIGLGGWIDGAIQLSKMSDKQNQSTIEMTPDGFDGQVAGVRVQIVDLQIDPTSFTVLGDMVADQSFALTRVAGRTSLRAGDEQEPSDMPQSERYTPERFGFWRLDRRNQIVWRVNGAERFRGQLWQMPALEVGPLTSSELSSHAGKATVTLQVLRSDRRGQQRTVAQSKTVVAFHGPFGIVDDAYFYNTRRHHLHVAPGAGRCYQGARGNPNNWQPGWPPPWEHELYTSCPDCFGVSRSVREVADELHALEARWQQGSLDSWRLTPPA